MPSKIYYLFVDTETTGLNYSSSGETTSNLLLEISYILTDKKLNVLCKNTMIAKHDISEIFGMMNRKVRTLHADNGLISDVSKSEFSTEEIDLELSYVLDEFTEENSKIVLAGSTIDFDREVIRRNLPNLYSRLHYRNLDISAIREFLSLCSRDFSYKISNQKKYLHRAENDIKESLEELIFFKENLLELKEF